MFNKVWVWVWLWVGSFLSVAMSAPAPSTVYQPATSSQRIVFHQPAQGGYQPSPPLPPSVHPGNQNDEALPKYEYKYEVSDMQSGDRKSHWERRDGDRVRGSYTLLDPDGVVRQVDYTADSKHGFNAVVTRNGQAKHPPQSHAFSKSNTSGHRPEYDRPSKGYIPSNSMVPSLHPNVGGSYLSHAPQDISTGYNIDHSTSTARKFYNF